MDQIAAKIINPIILKINFSIIYDQWKIDISINI